MIQTFSLDSRIKAFVELGKVMGQAAESYSKPESGFASLYPELSYSLQSAYQHNKWFTPSNIIFALNAWKEALTEESITKWTDIYKPGIQKTKAKRVAVIMAGNIPLVGFHDFLCTLISGHIFVGKLSSDDKILLPALADILCKIEPSFKERIQFSASTLKDFDAIIATGSNNTSRYFEYYFSKYPHIIRKNRNGVAVLDGNENTATLKKLGTDICTYFGLGCRNISKIYIPVGYAPEKLFAAIEPYKDALVMHNKYMNNHSYQSSIYLLNNTPHFDNDVFLLTESGQYSSPIPVLYYEFYDNIKMLKEKLKHDAGQIQCIASEILTSENVVRMGNTQHPDLNDYADGIDTLKFLIGQ